MSNTNNPGNIVTTIRSDLKMISRFLSRKRSRYIFLVIDDERVLKDFILSVQVELLSKKKEILHLELNREDIYIYKQVKDFLKDKECDGLIVSNLNALIYKDSFQCLSLLNKSRDAFSRFPLPMVFVVNRENLAKVIPGASDFYQLRDLPDFHIEDIKAVEEDISKIATRQYDQIESIDLKVALLEKQVDIAAAKATMDRDSLNNLVAPLLDLYIEKGDYKRAGELFRNHIEGKEKWIRDKMVLGGYYNLVDNEKAIVYFKQALDDYRVSGNKVFLLKCLLQLGNSYIDIGSYDEAGACYEEVLEIGRETGDLQGTSSGLHQKGNIAYLKGDYEAALSWYRKALEIAEKIGDISGAALTMAQMGSLYFQKQEFETALKLFIQAYLAFSELGSPNAGKAKKDIALVKEKLPETKFKNILKEFNLEGIENQVDFLT